MNSLILVPIIGALIVGIIFFVPDPSLEECQTATPDKYELDSYYTLVTSLNCFYETLPQYKYDLCLKEFSETKNHGNVLTLNTCPRGI